MAAGFGSGRAAFGLDSNPELVARVAVAAPLLVTSTVWLLLHVACRFDATSARRAASAVAWLLVAAAALTPVSRS